MTERSGKTAQVTIGLWFDDEHRRHAGGMPRSAMRGTSTSASRITAFPPSTPARRASAATHTCVGKLAKVLRGQGKPHPASIVEEWDYGRGE